VPAETHVVDGPLDRDAIFAIVRDQLVDILEIDPENISEGQSFKDDLNADSLALVELVDALEEELSERTVGFRIEHEGVVAALAGDTIPCEGLYDMCKDADVYVQTVLREDLVRTFAPLVPTGDRFLDILDYHSTVQQAGQTAAKCNVKTLLLTHFVPAIQPGQEEEWRAMAAEHFSGEIVVGPDLTFVEK